MESWRLRKRLAEKYVERKFGRGPAEYDAARDEKKKEIPKTRSPENLIGIVINENEVIEGTSPAKAYFSKFSTQDTQELFVSSQTHWLLTGPEFENEVQTKTPHGLISELKKINIKTDTNIISVVWPLDENSTVPNLKTVHQLIRELIIGMYIMNQVPNLNLEQIFDLASRCHLPPAYQDTLIGQLMITVDYMVKCMWHGSYFPPERLRKFNENWRSKLQLDEDGKPHCKLPVLYEFQSSGMYDITKESNYEELYSSLSKKTLSPLKPPRKFSAEMSDVIVTTTFYQQSINVTNNIYLQDSRYYIVGVRKTARDDITEADNASHYTHSLGEAIKNTIEKKSDIKYKLEQLKFISHLIPLFISFKRMGIIPCIRHLLPPMPRESLITERELPPLCVGKDYKNAAFFADNDYFDLHGGIQFDVETPSIEPLPVDMLEVIKKNLSNNEILNCSKWLHTDEQELVKVITIDNKRYCIMNLALEEFRIQKPIRPAWIRPLMAEIEHIKFMRIPLISSQIYKLFLQYCGIKQAEKLKDPELGLFEAAERGIVSIIHAIIRIIPPSRFDIQNLDDLSVTHISAMCNQVHVLALFTQLGLDINTRKGLYKIPTGLTPLHLAARVGAMQTLSFLLSAGADVNAVDSNGWTPIHHAAYNNQLQVARILVMRYNQLELETLNEWQLTPLLLAAYSGALETMICLLDMGADRSRTDDTGRNCIVLAALQYRHRILDFFIEQNFQDMLAWTTLVDMLGSPNELWRLGSTKTIEVLSDNSHHLQPILNAGIPDLLVEVLKEPGEGMQEAALISLSNISHDINVRLSITAADPVEVLIARLNSTNEKICTLAAHVITSIANVGNNKALLGKKGALEVLVKLLSSENDTLLEEVSTAIYVLSERNEFNQNVVASHGGIQSLINILTKNQMTDELLINVCQTVMALISSNEQNQLLMVENNGIGALAKLLQSSCINLQIIAAKILGVLASSHQNMISQELVRPMIAMLRVWDIEVRIYGANALWALAGITMAQQKFIAESVGVKLIINMLMTKSNELTDYGCVFTSAFALEDTANQNVFVKEGGVDALVRFVLSTDVPEATMFRVVRTLGILCLGVAHTNNRAVQKQIVKQDTIKQLIKFLNSDKYSEELQVEVIYTLACIVLNNSENLKILNMHGGFNYNLVIKQMNSPKEEVRIKAGMALCIYAFNKQSFQRELHKAGKIDYEFFNHFLTVKNEFNTCHAAFQMAVLAHLVKDVDPIIITAKGLGILSSKLRNTHDDTFTLAASLVSSLARSRTGISDGLVTLGVIELLLFKLKSSNSQISMTCSVALGYLSFNKKASRRLLNACRSDPGLYNILIKNLEGTGNKISSDFIQSFKMAKKVGFPSVPFKLKRPRSSSKKKLKMTCCTFDK